MKKIIIPVTDHFDIDPDHYVGELTLYKDVPPNTMITFGFEVIKKEGKPDKLKVIEAALVPQQHFKHFLDALPDSCVSAGGHVKGKGKQCQLCGTKL